MLTVTDIPESLRQITGAHIDLITSVNHAAGHPFTVGPNHVTAAADLHSGRLTEEVCRRIPCAARGCQSSYDAHKGDCVAFIKLTADVPQETIRTWLVLVIAAVEGKGLDGFAFVAGGGKITNG